MNHLFVLVFSFILFITGTNTWAKNKTSKNQTNTTTNEPHQGNAIDNFTKFDTNHDGFLSRREWPADKSIFDRLDKDQNNKLSRAEYTQTS